MFEYELDGEVLQFTQEDVDNRAKEKGLTTEDYLAQHPEVKPIAVEKTNDVAETGAPVASQTTAPVSGESPSVDTSPELPEPPSFGDKLYNNFQAFVNPFVSPEKKALYAAGIDAAELEETARVSSDDFKTQKVDLEKELDKAFGPDATLFGQMVENVDELTVQQRAADVGDHGDPKKYLMQMVKEQIGGMGLLNEKTELGESRFDLLNQDDIESVIEDKFHTKLEEFKINKGWERATDAKENIEAQGQDIGDWYTNSRRLFVNAYEGINKQIATYVEHINHGNLNEAQKTTATEELKKLKAQKGDEGTTMLFDLTTGQTTVARPEDEPNPNQRNLGVEEKQQIWRDKLDRQKPENKWGFLKNEFERSSLQLADLNTDLNQEMEWSVRKSGYQITSEKGEKGNRRLVTMTLREAMIMNASTGGQGIVPVSEIRGLNEDQRNDLVEKWERNFAVNEEDQMEYTGEFEALKRMYLLNEGIEDIEKPEFSRAELTLGLIPKNMAGLKQTAKTIVRPWSGDYFVDDLFGSTNRELLTDIGEVYDNLGIKKTKEEQEQLETSVAEMANDGLWGSNKMFAEFGGINKGLAVVGAAGKFGTLMNALTKGRYVKNGKTISEAAIKSRAAAKGVETEAYIASLGGRLKATKKAGEFAAMRFVPASRTSKGLAALSNGLMEGGKFSLFTKVDVLKGEMKHVDSEQFGFWEGFGFGAAGRILTPLAPLLSKKGFLKDIDKAVSISGREARIGLNSRKLFETFVTQPASFVAGSEFGGIMDNIAGDAMGITSFRNFMDDQYGHHDEVGKRLISNYFIGLGFGAGHMKGFADFKSKAALRRVRNIELDRMRQFGSLAELTPKELNNLFSEQSQNKIHKNLSDKNLKEFYDSYDIYDAMTARVQNLYRAEGYLDPNRAEELVRDDHKQFIAEEKSAGREIKFEVVNNDRLKFGQQKIDPNKRAEIFKQPGSDITTIRYNAKRYTPDVMAHELHHYYTEDLLGRDAVFKADFMNTLNGIASKIKLGRLVTEVEAKELGNEGRNGQKMTLSEAIKLEKFDLTSSRKNTKISQWELFAHIAEQLGNKNNYLDVKNTDGFVQLKELLSNIAKPTGKKLNLSREADVVRWFTEYAQNVKKGKSVVELFSELDAVVDKEASVILQKERLKLGQTGPDTWSSRDFELPMEGGRVNNPKEIAAESKNFFEKNNLKGKGLDAYRELMGQKLRPDGKYDLDFESPHTDFEYYPILGNKFGPMFDIAVAKYNMRVPERYRVNMADRSYGGERAELATATMTDKRGFQSILKTYDPAKGEFMSHVTGELNIRMQELKERSIDKKYESRAAEKEGVVVSGTDISEIKTDLIDISAGGGIDKRAGSTELSAETKGIKLRDYEFNYGNNIKRKINPESIQRIEKAGEDVFFETPLNELTYVGVSRRLRSATTPEMDLLFRGGKEGLTKPKDIKLAEDAIVENDAAILYDGMHEFSNPRFYENTNWGKTIFSKYYKNTGVKFKSTELPVDVTKETNARTTKWEKLEATPERLADFVQTLNTGRDAGTINKKRATLKEGFGDPFGMQIFRDLLNKPEFIERAEATPEGKAKLEGLKAELAVRKLRGATPEKLASKDLEIMDQFINDVKGIDYAKEPFPGFAVRNLIENTKEYKAILAKTGGVDPFLESMGYKLEGINLKTFQKYTEAKRLLDNLTVKDVTPVIFDGGYKGQKGRKGVHETIYEFAKENGIPEELLNLNIDASKRMADRDFSKDFVEKFIPDLFNKIDPRIIKSLQQMLRKTMGEGDQRFGYRPLVTRVSKKRGEVVERKIFDAEMGNGIINGLKGTKEINPKTNKPYTTKEFAKKFFDPNYVRVNVNATTKEKLNKLIDQGVPETTAEKIAFANRMKKILSPDKTIAGYEKMIKANEGMLEYFADKAYDYLKEAKTPEQKATAINNMSYLFQIQTNLGNGIFRGLATHNTVSIRKGAKHSEHDLQLGNYTGNILMSALKNSGNKSNFTNKVKQLTKAYKQSIIDKSIQETFDSAKYGGNKGFDFVFTTKSGKYPWLREQIIAETTLDLNTGKTYDQLLPDVIGGAKDVKALEARKDKLLEKAGLSSKDLSPTEKIIAMKTYDTAIANGRLRKKKPRGMSTFDFDETLIIGGKNFVTAKKGKESIKISSEQFPLKGPELAKKGYEFDFKDFVNVKGGKEGPLMQKLKNQIEKYGTDNVFVLTARMQEAAPAIHAWLKSKGVELKLENITGLGNSTGEAKALWMLEKFSEGYNDMYFVDDALPNVKAVRDVLNQLDIKSKVQQALASKDLNQGVNDMIEGTFGIESKKVYSKAEGKIRGKDIKRRRVFMPDAAGDLELLIEPLYGKGKKGIEDKKWFSENFQKPWERGINDFNHARQAVTNDYMSLRKQNKDVVKSLDKPVEGSNFTTDMALRVYIWNKNGFKIPDLTKTSEQKLVNHVKNNPKLQAYAESVARLTKLETGLKEPSAEWWGETIATEIQNLGEGIGRKKYIQDWIDVKNEMFSEANLNKMESVLGTRWRESVEDMFDRMETGRTRSQNLGRTGSAIMNYLNGSVGTIMNFNTRSATLQLISSVNFVNHSFNNPFAATRAFANQPQYWKDFMTIMNSDMLKQRRAGLEINVTEAELASAAKGSKNPAKAVIAKILKAGYLPTKIADSFAIASGGATYYRNAIRKYTKEGLSKTEAEKKAWIDFQAIAEKTQQSSRPDLLSQQQTSFAGRLILPFANTPMQMNRIMMKEALDLSKGRYEGFVGDNSFTNKMSKIAYYGFVQSALFAGLQSGLFALMGNSDDDELKAKKKVQAVNTMADSFLRGMGIQGAILSGIKSAILEFKNQNDKGWGADYSEVGEDLLNISPTVGPKFGKLDQAGNTYKWNKEQILEEGFEFSLDNPALEATTQVVEAIANIPVNRAHKKITNIQNALDNNYEDWQRISVGLGWSEWDVGIGQEKVAKEKKEKKEKKAKKKKESQQRCAKIKSNGTRCKIMVTKPKTRCHYHD